MTASGRVVGFLLLGAGLIIGGGIWIWLLLGLHSGDLESTGATLGFVFSLFFVIPLVGGGLFFVIRGQSEAREAERISEQRRLLDIVSTRGQVPISDLVLDLRTTREDVGRLLNELVGRGLFSGYVDWKKGILYSVDAAKLQGQNKCPNCGGEVALAGKGLIKCPYCGAEIFLSGG